MRVVIDIETNALHNPTKIWCVVCKDIDTKEVNIFRNLTDDQVERDRFCAYIHRCDRIIGHNGLGFDHPVLVALIADYNVSADKWVDTLILSKLANYSRPMGHSIESYGIEFGYEKGKNHYLDFFKQWSEELEVYCVRDVEICERVYNCYSDMVGSPVWGTAVVLEHSFQLICNDLQDNGFAFSVVKAESLLEKITKLLADLNRDIAEAFPPREVLIREFTPKLTKFGTISRTSVPRSLWPDIHKYEAGQTYRHTRFDDFNPSSHKQLIQVLNEAGWKPEEKTTTHVQAERDLHKLKYSRNVPEDQKALDIKAIESKLIRLRNSGWKISEHNLSTLPTSAPQPARTLAQRILLEARRRTLVEWLGLVGSDDRIHGKFYGIGAWTHRMAHQAPNTANIPKEFNIGGTRKLFGREMRELWTAPYNRLLVGVDAEGIQLRIFAHLIDDTEFTDALVKGKKDDKSDPHSLNQRILGSCCKTRDAAKRFIYALLLGAGLDKLANILECSKDQAKEGLDRLLLRYTGFADLKRTTIPKDAKRGYFLGLDGRRVSIPGDTQRDREHLAMSGYLQNGEAIVVKRAACWIDQHLADEKVSKQWLFVNIVHDELQSETANNMEVALKVARIKADAIRIAGEELKLKCPLAGSYWNDDHKDYTIGTNWYKTH